MPAVPAVKGKVLRIHVSEVGKPDVNAKIPINLTRFGMRIAATTAGEHLRKSGVDLAEVLKEIDTVGQIVDVTDENVHIEIFVE